MRVHCVRCRGSQVLGQARAPEEARCRPSSSARGSCRGPPSRCCPGALTVTRSTPTARAVGEDRARVARVDHRRVAGAADAQERAGGVDPARGVRHAARARAAGTASRARAAPRARSSANGATSTRVPRRHADARRLRERGGVLAGQRRLDPPAGIERGAGAPRLLLVEHVRAVAPELAHERVGDPLLDDRHRLVRAQDRVVERLRVGQAGGRLGQVGASRRPAPGTLPGPTPSAGLPER